MATTLDIRRPSKHVAEVWLNRPEVRNAFNDGVITELTEAFRTLGSDADLRAIVLGGHGKAFCAGADLGWMRAMADYSWQQNRDAVGHLVLPRARGGPRARRLLRRRPGPGGRV